jgi:hypothetical protein
MKYESLDALSHEQAEALVRSGDVQALSRAVVALALADGDLPWTTAFLLSLIGHASANVRGNVLLGFGHLARRFRTLPRAHSRRADRRAQEGDRPLSSFIPGDECVHHQG